MRGSFGKASGVILTRKMVEVDYYVHYTIHVTTHKDAMQLVQHMPYRGQALSIQDVNAYARPVIEQAVSQRVLSIAIGQTPGLQMRQDISQLVYQCLHPVLSDYGITLDTVEIQGLRLRDERIKPKLRLPALIPANAQVLSRSPYRTFSQYFISSTYAVPFEEENNNEPEN